MPRRNSKRLTDPGIGKIGRAPKGKRIERFDAGVPGLCLRVTDNGVKSWSVYFRLHGRNQRMTLDPWPAVGVAEARKRAQAAKDQAKAGIDPREAEEATRRAAREKADNTFGALAEKYIKRECDRLKRGQQVEVIIRRELLPVWGRIPVESLRRKDLTALTDALLDAGKPMAAHKVHEIARRIFGWALDRGDIETSPLVAMKPPVVKEPRARKLDNGEVTALWAASTLEGYPYGDLTKLLLLTGTRLREAADAAWSEIDLEDKTWVIPAGRIKSKRDHLVPLSSMAVSILEDLPRFDDGECIFSTTAGLRPVTGFSEAKRRLDRAIEKVSDNGPLLPWCFHDLRRTVRTGLAALGVPEIVSEHVLAHGPRDPLVRTYNVHAYHKEKSEALEAWAGHVRNLVEPPPANVVALSA